MTNPAYEKLVEEVAAIRANFDEGLDAENPWGFRLLANSRDAPHDGDCTKSSHACLKCGYDELTRQARAMLYPVAKALETVTPEMVEAWEMAMPPEEFDLEGQSDAVINLAHAQSNWSAMLAASPLHERK